MNVRHRLDVRLGGFHAGIKHGQNNVVHRRRARIECDAIQVGTELLIRMRRKPKVQVGMERIRVAAQTYSILPRTMELIERLLPCYEKRGTVLRAVVEILREQP